jgi:hypothetical protein
MEGATAAGSAPEWQSNRLAAVDPRVKLGWVLATLVAGLVFVDPRSLLVVLASIVLVAAVAGVLGETIRRLRSLGVIVIVLVLIVCVNV